MKQRELSNFNFPQVYDKKIVLTTLIMFAKQARVTAVQHFILCSFNGNQNVIYNIQLISSLDRDSHILST